MMYNNACSIVVSIINNNDNVVAMHLKKGRNEQNYQTIVGCNTHGINSCCFVVLTSTASLAATRRRPVLNNDYNQKLE